MQAPEDLSGRGFVRQVPQPAGKRDLPRSCGLLWSHPVPCCVWKKVLFAITLFRNCLTFSQVMVGSSALALKVCFRFSKPVLGFHKLTATIFTLSQLRCFFDARQEAWRQAISVQAAAGFEGLWGARQACRLRPRQHDDLLEAMGCCFGARLLEVFLLR